MMISFQLTLYYRAASAWRSDVKRETVALLYFSPSVRQSVRHSVTLWHCERLTVKTCDFYSTRMLVLSH